MIGVKGEDHLESLLALQSGVGKAHRICPQTPLGVMVEKATDSRQTFIPASL